MDLYEILNIPEDIIVNKEENINYILANMNSENDLASLNKAIDIVEKFHSYFHFEQSYAYLFCAFLYKVLDDKKETIDYVKKSIFQDHINEVALNFDKASFDDILSYNSCIKYEEKFIEFAITKHKKWQEIEILDNAIKYVLEGNIEKASKILDKNSYKSHRYYIALSIISYHDKNYPKALEYIFEAVTMLENAHKDYHQYASILYQKRSKIFSALGKNDLAKNDLIKSKDLVA